MKWLEDLKVGDEVAVVTHYPGSGNIAKFDKIARITKTLIIVDFGQRFRKTNGYEPGTAWNKSHIEPLNDSLREQIRIADKRLKFRRVCDKLKTIKEPSEAVLDAVLLAYNQFQTGERAKQ